MLNVLPRVFHIPDTKRKESKLQQMPILKKTSFSKKQSAYKKPDWAKYAKIGFLRPVFSRIRKKSSILSLYQKI